MKKLITLVFTLCLVAALTGTCLAATKVISPLTLPPGVIGYMTVGGLIYPIYGTPNGHGGYVIPFQTFSKPGVFNGSFSGTITK